MGSFLLHDDYRFPDGDFLPEKLKSSTSGQQTIFENNLAFTNIKRGLGFDTGPSNSETSSDEWTSRARASPVVERLIFQELQSDVVEYARNIEVPMDPRQWLIEHTQKWLRWVGELYQIGDLTHRLSFDGPTLCGFTEHQFTILAGSKDVGQKIAAQLDIWKKVTRMTPSGSSYHFQQQQAMDHKLGQVSNRPGNNTPKLLDGCWEPPAPQQFAANNDTPSSNQFTSEMNNGRQRGNFPSSMGNSNSFSSFNSANQLPFELEQMHARGTPRPTIPLDRFRSVRDAHQQNGYIPLDVYEQFTSTLPNKQTLNMVYSSGLKDNNIAVRNTSTANTFLTVKPKKEPVVQTSSASSTQAAPSTTMPSAQGAPSTIMPSAQGAPSTTMPPAEPQVELTTLSNMNSEMRAEFHDDMCSEYAEPDFSEVNLLNLKTEKTSEVSNDAPMDTVETKATSEKPSKKKASKHPIHLWEFLKQLLHDGKECIRWIDQERGVFKIYNSQEVAKFWGERKNRPAMNYDKLSRSIRQYYKKGIIKKTSQGKRLVYQFCEGYL